MYNGENLPGNNPGHGVIHQHLDIVPKTASRYNTIDQDPVADQNSQKAEETTKVGNDQKTGTDAVFEDSLIV